MDFRTFFLGLDAPARESFAKRVASSVGYLTQVAYGNKKVELGFADVLVSVAEGAVTLDELPLTDRAKQQHCIRTTPGALDTEPKAAAA